MQPSPRFHPAVAFVAPFAVFLLFNVLVPLVAIQNSELPWWRSAPEHWIYPLQTLVCGGLLIYFRSAYTFKPWRGFVLATVFGVAGIVVWVAPAWLYLHEGTSATEFSWLGFAPRIGGYDPTIFSSSTAAYVGDVFLRFVRLVVVVPLLEEIFWRGFLMRYVIAEGRSFLNIPFGTHRWSAFAITTAAFTLEHAKEDWLGALIFGSLMYFLCVRTKSLAACVWMHAVANLALGLYVMKTRQWGFW